MKIIIPYALMLFVLYNNWTDVGVDNERLALDKIKNSRGMLEKVKE